MTLLKRFLELTKANSRKVFLRTSDGKSSYTFGEIAAISRKASALLDQHGLKAGEHFAIALPNIPEFVFFFFAAVLRGGTGVILNPSLHPSELQNIVFHSESKVLITTSDLKGRLQEKFPDSLKIVSVDELANVSSGEESGGLAYPGEADDKLAIMYTSGSTGNPKGAVLPFSHFEASAGTFVKRLGLHEKSIMLGVLPVFTSPAVLITILSTFFSSAELVLSQAFHPLMISSFWDTVRSYKVTNCAVVPTILQLLLDLSEPPGTRSSTLSYLLCMGAPLYPELRQEFEKKMGVRLGILYGLTETGPCTFSLPLDGSSPGHVGKPFHSEIRIVDEKGKDLPAGSVGEVLVRCPGMLKEYFKNPEATSRALKEGWFFTGDLGWIDKGGFLHLEGRKDRTLIRGGLKVQPEEIDCALAGHPLVKESVTIGVRGRHGDDEIRSYVVLWSHESLGQEKRLQAELVLKSFLRENLSHFKIPDKIIVIDEIPKSGGKILLREVTKLPI